LLAAGAAASARDASGASPLFVAAEAGKAAAAAALLKAGATPLMSNTAGETPLYIAALRGHLPVVELLLRHMAAAGIDWTQSRLYGDAWTPLMAAAVANRVDVALCLLRTAQQEQQQMQSRALRRTSHEAGDCAGWCSGPGQPIGSSSGGADAAHVAGVQRLLAAVNRYGQTALHIAGGCTGGGAAAARLHVHDM
jgi:ankyrin repeat protein